MEFWAVIYTELGMLAAMLVILIAILWRIW